MIKRLLGTTGLLAFIAVLLLALAPTLFFGPERDLEIPPLTGQPVRRVAVVGGGIGGLSLATILGRSGRHKVHVFERAPHDRDEGYGLDFHWKGQQMLKLAGIWNKYWTFSRPFSDVFKVFEMNSENPIFIMYKPAFLIRWFPRIFYPNPESNRVAFRAALLEEMEKNNVKISYEHTITNLTRTPTGGAEIFDANGQSHGQYDLVVDASGVHSLLRHLRVSDPVGKHLSPRLLIHGVITDPEATCPPDIVSKLEQGTYASLARGYFFVLQRFGAAPTDHRTAFFYQLHREANQTSIFSEIGIERQSNAIVDPTTLAKVKDWLHADMGDFLKPSYHKVVDAVEKITIAHLFTHGEDTALKPEMDLPLVCIGDALRNIGLGGGGELACEDVVDLTNILLHENNETIDFEPIRKMEQESLDRRIEFLSNRFMEDILHRRPNPGEDLDLTRGSRGWRVFLDTSSWIFTKLYALEKAVYGRSGSPPQF